MHECFFKPQGYDVEHATVPTLLYQRHEFVFFATKQTSPESSSSFTQALQIIVHAPAAP